MRRALSITALALALAACRGEPSQIQVVVDAEPGVRAQTRTLQVRIYGGDPSAAPEDYLERYSVPAPIAFAEWPRTFALTPLDGDAARQYRVEATALRAGGEPVATTRIVSGYRPGRTLRVVLLLTDACIGVPCDRLDEACDPQLRACADAHRDPGDLEEIGRDAGVPEVGGDACASAGDCDDDIDCTEDLCLSNRCSHTYHDEMCEDAIPCTQGICLPSGCQSRPVDERCDDSNECTVDSCSVRDGCHNEPDDTLCTAGADGRCDAASGCQYSTCQEGVTCITGPCRPTATCVGDTCERPSICTSPEVCCGDACVMPGCDDGNPCTDDACEITGCNHVARPGRACDDGDACTVFDHCDATGVCVAGDPCDDANPCTTDTCGASGCVFTPVAPGTSCDDGDGCGPDVCSGTVCNHATCTDAGVGCSTPADCDDSDPCTDDSCSAGVCMNVVSGVCDDAGVFDAGCGCAPTESCCGGFCCTSDEICTGGASCIPLDAGIPGDAGHEAGTADAGTCGGSFCTGSEECCSFMGGAAFGCCPSGTCGLMDCIDSGLTGTFDAGVP